MIVRMGKGGVQGLSHTVVIADEEEDMDDMEAVKRIISVESAKRMIPILEREMKDAQDKFKETKTLMHADPVAFTKEHQSFDGLPEHMHGAYARLWCLGLEPGSFLQAVLQNRLTAVRLADHINFANLLHIVHWRGSVDIRCRDMGYESWVKRGGYLGILQEELFTKIRQLEAKLDKNRRIIATPEDINSAHNYTALTNKTMHPDFFQATVAVSSWGDISDGIAISNGTITEVLCPQCGAKAVSYYK